MKKMFEQCAQRWDIVFAVSAGLIFVAAVIFGRTQFRAAQQEYERRLCRLAAGRSEETARRRREDMPAMLNTDSVYALLHPAPAAAFRDLFDPGTLPLAANAAIAAGDALPELELMAIEFRPRPLQYRGRMVLPNGIQIAQVNNCRTSYFVRTGMVVEGYVVTAVDQERVVLQKDGQLLRLPYRAPSLGGERLARIKDCRSQQIREVSNGDTISGFEVLDITEQVVLLSNHVRHLELQTGKVAP